jgi:hypothetical protein
MHGVTRDRNPAIGRAPNLETSSHPWGDALDLPKPNRTFRFIFQNIQGLPVNPHSHKHQQIITALQETGADTFGMAELNLNFRVLGSTSQWNDRFQKLRRNHSVHTYNRHDMSQERLLFGGTAQITTGACSHRATASGTDESGMGRWVWTLFAGKNNIKLRVLSGYRPNPDSNDRPGTVFSQQERHLRSQNDDRDPRRAFIKDLEAQLDVWMTAGNLIIIGLDANDNVRTGPVNAMLRNRGLVEVHSAQHPHLPPRATCNKNTQDIPVDGIWASPSLDCSSAGYLGFGEIIIGKTDHRLIWADFTFESALGFQPPEPSYVAPQRLTLNDPRVVKKYNRILRHEHNRLRLGIRSFALQSAVPSGLTPAHHKEYETIAHLDDCARKHANKKCRKLRMGALDFSDSLKIARGTIDLWDLLLRKRNGIRASTKKIRRLMHLTGNMSAFEQSIPTIITRQKTSMSSYKALKKKSGQERILFGKRLLKARAKERNTTVEAQATQLKNAFGQRKLAQRVKRLTGKQRGAPLRSVNAPANNSDIDRVECTDKLSIEKAFACEGTRRFSQTIGTPLMQPDFVQRVGYLAELPGAEEILNGTFVPEPGMDPYAVQFLSHLKMETAVSTQPPISKVISTQSYRDSWKKMKPNTSSSPFGPTFVHYIAGSRDQQIAEFDATMANIPYASGYSPEVWINMVDVLIPKKTTSSAIEKLRIIVLFHALFNMNNKRIGREMVANAERLNQIPWEAYGSRKCHRSIECAANKVFTTDIARQEHRSMALCSNDAKSCYDRILHAIATICMRRVGVPKKICLMMFGTLAKVKHYIRTTYGDSTTSYSCIEIPFQGIYQGNGAGPGIWLLVSIPIINMLKTAGFGFRVRTVISGDEFSFVCYTFVDDSDVVHSCLDTNNSDDTANLVSEMQQAVDTWEGGLRASGGALVPTKSYWFLIHFVFERNSWRYARLDETPGNITIRDIPGTARVELERLDVHEARETLGVFIAMNGNQEAQTQELWEKSTAWADKVRSGRFSPAEAWFSIQFCIMKSLEYPLMATSLSKAQCNRIMQPIRAAALPALGINRHLTMVVAHGPKRYQGVGIPDLWTVQGILKLWLALQHGDAPTITGHQLRASMELHTIEIGLPGQLLHQDYKKFGKLATNSWLKHLWEFCDDSNLQLTSTTPQLHLARDHDEFLMTAFASHGYRDSQLTLLNLCRLSCHALRLSDISTGDGRRILPKSWQGYPTDSSGCEFEWPYHGRPSKMAWDLWKLALRKCFLTIETTQQILRQPLGSWTNPTPPTWHWFYSPSQDRVYHHLPDDSRYDTYSALPNQRRLRSPKYFLTTTTIAMPLDAERTTTTEHSNFVWCHGSAISSYAIRPILSITDLIHDNDKWAIRTLHCPENGSNVAQAILRGNAIAVCDGSYKDHFGTAAFVLQNGNSKTSRILGAHVTPGHPDDINPYRSELGGILAIVIIAEAIATFHDIAEGTIEIGCDCQSGLIAVFEHAYDTSKQPHHDIIHEIRRKLADSRLTWKFRHVDGHQDKHISYHLLDMWGQLNVEMDSIAKVYWNETKPLVLPFYPPSSYGWSLWVGERKLASWDRESLYNHAQSTPILEHWSKRRNIPHHLIHSIDWEACEDAIKLLGLTRSLWIPKWLAGFAPVGKVQQRNMFQDHAECPRCSAFETTAHVLLCPAPQAQRQWDSSLSSLDQWFVKALTLPDLRNAIITRLQSWRNQDGEPQAPSYNWPGVNDIVRDQDAVGWRAFLEGGVLHAWAAKQQEYYNWIKRRNTGKRWITTLIKKLWEISWNMWEQRNGEVNNPESPASLREHARLDALITSNYEDVSTLAIKDRRWFRRLKEVLFTESLEYKHQWLESVRLARIRYARRRRTSTQAQRTLMRQTFRRRSTREPQQIIHPSNL